MTWWLQAICYAADFAIIVTYGLVRRNPRWFDWANVLSSPVIIVTEVATGAYPVMPITVFFGAIAGWHLWTDRRA